MSFAGIEVLPVDGDFLFAFRGAGLNVWGGGKVSPSVAESISDGGAGVGFFDAGFEQGLVLKVGERHIRHSFTKPGFWQAGFYK